MSEIKKDQRTSEPEPESRTDDAVLTELGLRIWSVIGFEGCIANGLTYDEAVEELAKHSDSRQSGLCIVTDDAAARIRTRTESIL